MFLRSQGEKDPQNLPPAFLLWIFLSQTETWTLRKLWDLLNGQNFLSSIRNTKQPNLTNTSSSFQDPKLESLTLQHSAQLTHKTVVVWRIKIFILRRQGRHRPSNQNLVQRKAQGRSSMSPYMTDWVRLRSNIKLNQKRRRDESNRRQSRRQRKIPWSLSCTPNFPIPI